LDRFARPSPVGLSRPCRASPFGATTTGQTDGDVVHLVFRVGTGLSAVPLSSLRGALRPPPGRRPPRTDAARCVLSRVRAGAWSAPCYRILQGASCGGKNPVEAAALGRSLLPSATLEHVAALRSSRTFDRSARRTFNPTCATLLTLAPTFPSRSGPCDPAMTPGFLSWGCPKIAPPSFWPRSPSPGHRFDASPRRPDSFGMGRPLPIRVPPSWFLTTSAVCSSSTLQPFAGCCRSWGSTRFLLSRNRIPRDAPAALRSVPSADSDG